MGYWGFGAVRIFSLLHQKLYMLNSCIVRKKSPVTRRVTPHTDESPSRGSKASNTGKQREGMVSILSNLASQTIGDMSSVGFYGNGYKGKTLTEGAGAIIENFFDRITAEDAQKAPLSSSIPEHVVGTPHSGLLSLNGASSWSSDRSWEMYAGHIDKRNREKSLEAKLKVKPVKGRPGSPRMICFSIRKEETLSRRRRLIQQRT
ncbi:hypothetical protein BC829DRAFT_100598 [Chytridium lagenaria]|nr:hypothetical protein BC829DRAFT_100598 [Chytridium lagenaria]